MSAFVSCITHAAPGSNARALCTCVMHKEKQGKPGKDSQGTAEFSVARMGMGWGWLETHTCAQTRTNAAPTEIASSCAWEGPGERCPDRVKGRRRVSSAQHQSCSWERWEKMLNLPYSCSATAVLRRQWWTLWRRCSFSSCCWKSYSFYHWRSSSTTKAKTPGWQNSPSPEEVVHVSVTVAGKWQSHSTHGVQPADPFTLWNHPNSFSMTPRSEMQHNVM